MTNTEGTSTFLSRLTFTIVRLTVYTPNDQIIISFTQITTNTKPLSTVNEKRKAVTKRNKNQIENKNKEKGKKNNMNAFPMKSYVEMSLLHNHATAVRMQRLSYRVTVCRTFETTDPSCVASLKIVPRDDTCQNRNNLFITVCIMFIVISLPYIERIFLVSLQNMSSFHNYKSFNIAMRAIFAGYQKYTNNQN